MKKTEVPENCPLKESENSPVSCPCYYLQNCDVKLKKKPLFSFLSKEDAFCAMRGCEEPAVGRAFFRDKSKPFCISHLEYLKRHGARTKLYSESDATYKWWEE